jgi:NIMA-interacting peptidyl-prolyl cis-trans isomerase 1
MALIALLVIGCSNLTKPLSEETGAAAVARAPTPPPVAPSEPAAPPAESERVRAETDDRITASHVLVAFKGSRRAREDITRTKQQAKQRAEEVRAKALKSDDFEALAKQYSDDPSAGKGGGLGSFGRTSMVKPFADAAFALNVGAVSDVVETEFGFHVIKRTK